MLPLPSIARRQRTNRPRAHTPLARALTALGLALFTASLTGSIAHLEMVKHEICAEHGALVEHYGALVEHNGHASDTQRSEPDAHATHESHEPQKHCSLLLSTACLAVTPSFDLVHALVLVVDVAPPSAPAFGVNHKRAPLSFAPKTSPPLV